MSAMSLTGAVALGPVDFEIFDHGDADAGHSEFLPDLWECELAQFLGIGFLGGGFFW
jgi:hypothetical protein